jgi:photosynthetic reaction center H subunit
MHTGAITQYVDVAQLVLYGFWIFFAGVVIYIRREDKREGYPLESERSPYVKVQGWPAMPEPKTFLNPHGGSVQKPDYRKDDRPVKAEPTAGWLGAPLEPTGNPMLDCVGPASYAARGDVPDLTLDGAVKIVPLRVDPAFGISTFDLNPMGQEVVGGDGYVAGKVCDVWVDRTEPQVRYLEVAVKSNGRRVLVPWGFVKMDGPGRCVRVRSIFASQFADVPGTADPDRVTLREEDQISAYYGGGTLYASPDRLGPWL